MPLLCVLFTVSMSKSRDPIMPAAGDCHPSCLLTLLLTSLTCNCDCAEGAGPPVPCPSFQTITVTARQADPQLGTSWNQFLSIQSHQCSGHQNYQAAGCSCKSALFGFDLSVASYVFIPPLCGGLYIFTKDTQGKRRLFLNK